MYLLKLAMRPWRRALWSQAFSAFGVAFLLLLLGVLFWMNQGFRSVIWKLKGEQVITLYLQPSVKQGEEAAVVEAIQTALGSAALGSGVDLKLVQPQQFIRSIQTPYPELAKELEGLPSTELSQVVPRYISLTGMLGDSIAEKLKDIPGIESIDESKERYRQIVGAFSVVRWLTRVLIAGLSIALVIGLIHLSRSNSYLQSDALELMRQWGAGRFALICPGTLSGMLVGLLGGVMAVVAWYSVGLLLASHIKSLSILLRGMPSFGPIYAVSLLGLGVLLGALAGAIGSLPSTGTVRE